MISFNAVYPIALLVVFHLEDVIRLGDHEGDDVGGESRVSQGYQRIGILTLEDVRTENRG